MTWYKFTANHGGGHQGHTEEYQWHDFEVKEDYLENFWIEWTEEKGFNQAKGTVEQLEDIPIEEKYKYKESAIRKFQEAKKMLERIKLENDEIIPENNQLICIFPNNEVRFI